MTFTLRRVGTVNTRVALSLQNEISELEEQLEVCEAANSSRDCQDVNCGMSSEDFPDRKDLLRTIADRISTYSRDISSGHYPFERTLMSSFQSINIAISQMPSSYNNPF